MLKLLLQRSAPVEVAAARAYALLEDSERQRGLGNALGALYRAKTPARVLRFLVSYCGR